MHINNVRVRLIRKTLMQEVLSGLATWGVRDHALLANTTLSGPLLTAPSQLGNTILLGPLRPVSKHYFVWTIMYSTHDASCYHRDLHIIYPYNWWVYCVCLGLPSYHPRQHEWTTAHQFELRDYWPKTSNVWLAFKCLQHFVRTATWLPWSIRDA